MTVKSEILFVDRSVDDLGSILAGLRPGVGIVMLHGAQSAAAQIAAALAGLTRLEAIHLMAHGASGRVSLAAGDWTAASVARDAADLAAIGRALAPDGDLRLWSCETAAGPAGEAFIDALAEAAGAEVSAARRRVGAADLGGSWELAARAARPAPRPPLTEAGIAGVSGGLAAYVWQGPTNGNWGTGANWKVGSTTQTNPPGSGDTVSIPNSTTSVVVNVNSTCSSLTLGNGQNGSGKTATLTINSGETLTVVGAITSSFGNNNSGTISMLGTATLAAASLDLSSQSSTLSGSGTLNISGHILTGTTLQASANNGNTTLDVFGTIDSGVISQINAGSILEINGTVASGDTVTLESAAAGTVLDIAGAAGTISSRSPQRISSHDSGAGRQRRRHAVNREHH